jgi:hypothetical protein
LRYAGHTIRRPENLPQKALFRAKPNGRRNQGRPKSRWADRVNSDSLALRVRDWTHCAQGNLSKKFLLLDSSKVLFSVQGNLDSFRNFKDKKVGCATVALFLRIRGSIQSRQAVLLMTIGNSVKHYGLLLILNHQGWD